MAYHMNKETGSVGKCKAQPDNCPFGTAEEHHESAAGARKMFENYMNSRPLDRSSLKSLTASELNKVLLDEAAEIDAKLDLPKIEKASQFAKQLHRGQFRRAAPWEERPAYIVHPLRNSIRMIRWGGKSTELVLAGLLHDVVEDSAEAYCKARGIPFKDENHAREILLNRIRKDYGARTAEIIFKLSNPVQDEEKWSKLSNDEKHAIYVAHVKEAIADDPEVLIAKISDLYDNGAGLYHTAFPGNEKQTAKQASKYLLLLPVMREELERNPINNPVLRHSIQQALQTIEDRLNALL